MKKANIGYYRQPTIWEDKIIFICEADLWEVSAAGGQARRLTVNKVECTTPFLSPDGQSVAFGGTDEGKPEIYVMDAAGGHPRRLTFQGCSSYVCGWSLDGGEILYSSIADQPLLGYRRMWTVAAAGGVPRVMPIGPAARISLSPRGRVISRNEQEYSIWKRYKGGFKGDLWIDRDGSGFFEPILAALDGNLCRPMWLGDRIYFLSDYQGHGNIYSCTLAGEDLQRHTDHEDYYVRAATTDGKRIVYQCGAQIYVYDPGSGETQGVEIRINSSKPQSVRKFVPAHKFLEQFRLHPEGHSLVLTTRGKPFIMGNWERAVVQLGIRDGVRYRLSQWLFDGQHVISVTDQNGEEELEIHAVASDEETMKAPRQLSGLDLGRILALTVSPVDHQILITNQRNEIIWLDLKSKEFKVLDKSDHSPIKGIDFSPDGKWAAYAASKTAATSQIYLCEIATGQITTVTDPIGLSMAPRFDPEGRYLYFISYRTFNPVYDRVRFDIGFPRGAKPYLVTLQRDLCSPFDPPPSPLTSPKKDELKREEDQSPDKIQEPVRIDCQGINNRLIPFPVPEGIFGQIEASKEMVFYSQFPIEGARTEDDDEGGSKGLLKAFDLEKLKDETIATRIGYFTLSPDGKTLAYKTKGGLRVIRAGEKPSDEDHIPGRQSGWIDLERIKVSVVPGAEWQQMYRELWRLQREHFWSTSMSNVDWEGVYHRYKPLLERVATREEFSDLTWEVHGELGTSHAYEVGGDAPQPPCYGVGKLAADITLRNGHWIIDHIVRGDCWDHKYDSPLNAPGLNVQVGDEIVAVDDVPLTPASILGELLVNKANTSLTLTIRSQQSNKIRRVTVNTLSDDTKARYREWVESNRSKVHEVTQGRIGYLHIPNMEPEGYAEFFRYYLIESMRDGLIIDVRYNGGGHVSQLLLEKLARKRLGYSTSHHYAPEPMPNYSVLGPLVAITNEVAGSDGDIFSHSFKMLKLGTLIGKRTWGGVVGIGSHSRLVDDTLVTQPEFAIWFYDVGYGVENYGAVPDVEVEIKPQDYQAGKDTQLDKAIEIIMQKIEAEPPPYPELDNKPDLAPTRLPQ
ncbi:S41 family peptidase [candidate division CSSED10-310 bacterium]|uniref:Tricorn protease homolog n=1 Tax=candidate division CSSED10-310 bacterium TaxID=2855610 RepID=A0ABV6Z2N0_UNCC1